MVESGRKAWRRGKLGVAQRFFVRERERSSATKCLQTGAIQLNLVGITSRNLVRQLTRILASSMVFLFAPFSLYKRGFRITCRLMYSGIQR